jgi:hypothetical protein
MITDNISPVELEVLSFSYDRDTSYDEVYVCFLYVTDHPRWEKRTSREGLRYYEVI